MATSGGRTSKNAIYIQEKLKPQMKNLECQTKEVGRVWVEWGPPGKPELWPERDCRDLLPLCVNSEMSPIAHLNYRQVPRIYRKHPQTEKKHKSPCLLLSLYTAIYMMQSREIKTVQTPITSICWAWCPAIFSRMWVFNESTGLAAVCVPV